MFRHFEFIPFPFYKLILKVHLGELIECIALHCTMNHQQSTVEALVSGLLYLWPPCLKPRFNSHTNSVFLHSRLRTKTLSEITT